MADTRFHLTSIQVLLCLVMAIMVKSVTSAPVSTGEEIGTLNPSSVSNNAKIIVGETEELYKKLCNTPNLCGSSMERNLKLELKLPEMSNKCLSKEFNKDQCLKTIYRDLLRFQIYFKFLKESFKGVQERVESIQYKTKSLAEAVKSMAKIDQEETGDTDSDISLKLQSKDPWNEKLTTYLILQSFKDYMMKTTRAIRNS